MIVSTEPLIELIHGDCMEGMEYMMDEKFGLAIVDPPYGIGADSPSKKSEGVRQKNGVVLNTKLADYGKKDWDCLVEDDYFDALRRVSEHQIVWGCNYYPSLGPGRLVWDKMNDASNQFDCEIAYQSFDNSTRLVYYMWAGMMQGLNASDKLKVACKQQGNKKLNEERIHPTQKPVALYKWILKKYGYYRDGSKRTILDTHGGSMSIAVACYDMGFDLRLYELDGDYYESGVRRFLDHKKQLKLF